MVSVNYAEKNNNVANYNNFNNRKGPFKKKNFQNQNKENIYNNYNNLVDKNNNKRPNKEP